MEDNSDLSIDAASVGSNGTVLLTLRLRGKPVYLDKTDLAKESKRNEVIEILHNRFPGTKEVPLEQLLLEAAAKSSAHRNDEPVEEEAPDLAAQSAENLAKTPEAVRLEAEAMLKSPDLVNSIVRDVEAIGVAGEQDLAMTVYTVGTSRQLDKPLAAIVQGPTASGKSYVIEKIASLIPPEAVVRATQMTPQSLFHMKPDSLRHRFVTAGERSRARGNEAAEATRALREMISSGRLSKLMPMKSGGEIQTVLIEQDGPIAFAESTTMTRIFEEDLNRCLLLSTDERSDQTARIVRWLASDYAGTSSRERAERIVLRHHAMQRMLQRHMIVIPFAERLGDLIPHEQVEVRRVFPQLMSMIQAVTLLHQLQRPLDRDGRLVATCDDYRLVHRLLAKPVARVLGRRLSDAAQRFYDRLSDWFGNTEFTTPDAEKRETKSRSSVYGWMHELHDFGLVDQVERQAGTRAAVWRLSNNEAGQVISALPNPDELFSE
jgi:hypothetical protein